MDRDISYILFLLLIISVAVITTLGSTIKAKNPNGEVNWTELTYVIVCLRNLLFPKWNCVSLKIPIVFAIVFVPWAMNDSRIII